MVNIKKYAISFLIVALLKVVTAHNDDHKSEARVSGFRIVGGQNARPGELPFQVSIYIHGSHWCGGSIIDNKHVLTAGHCVYELSPEHLLVIAGVLNNTVESSEDTKVVREVTDLFLHEEYDDDTYINDIAIIKVSPDFPTDNPAVKPIALRKDVARDGIRCTVSGWGKLGDSQEGMPQILQVVDVFFVTYDTCRSINSDIEPGMNCAGERKGGKDACVGDSGGPLQCGGFLTGVVSWSKSCGVPNQPGVYADVAFYNEWIEGKLRKGRDEL